MDVRPMHDDEVDAAIAVWLAANRARGKRVAPARRARVRGKLAEPDAVVLVAADPAVVGMAHAEPGRADGGAGAVLPDLLHVSMVFVDPVNQRRGVGRALLAGLAEVAAGEGRSRLSLWTASDNEPARRLYEDARMTVVDRRRVGATAEWVRYERVLAASPGLSARHREV